MWAEQIWATINAGSKKHSNLLIPVNYQVMNLDMKRQANLQQAAIIVCTCAIAKINPLARAYLNGKYVCSWQINDAKPEQNAVFLHEGFFQIIDENVHQAIAK